MRTATRKRFDLQVTEANKTYTKNFELEKNIVAINGILVTSDKDEQLYFRGTQKIEVSKREVFPENYESKLLMSGVNVPPSSRYYDVKGMSPGNGTVGLIYTDADDGRTGFDAYRVSLYLDCEMEELE